MKIPMYYNPRDYREIERMMKKELYMELRILQF